MFARSLVGTSALAALIGLTGATPAEAKFPAKAINQAAQHQPLHQALRDLKMAEASLKAGNGQLAHKQIGAAIHQVEQAIHHHHKNKPTAGGGLAGNLGAATKHHHHHSHLQKAVHDLRVAEKQIKAGKTSQAIKDIDKAEKQLHVAIGHVQQLAKK